MHHSWRLVKTNFYLLCAPVHYYSTLYKWHFLFLSEPVSNLHKNKTDVAVKVDLSTPIFELVLGNPGVGHITLSIS